MRTPWRDGGLTLALLAFTSAALAFGLGFYASFPYRLLPVFVGSFIMVRALRFIITGK